MVARTRIALTTLVLCLGAAPYGAQADTGQTGIASYYWQGRATASGERFNPNGLTAAHRSLPFNTKVKVTNLKNGRSVIVRINDRGPFIRGRVIDISRAAAGELGFVGHGLTKVRLTVLDDDTPVSTASAAPAETARPKERTRVAALEPQQEQTAAPQSAPASPSTDGGWTLVPSPSQQAQAAGEPAQP